MTKKQQSFINHYVKCKNGAEAVRLAGYSHQGADRMAHILLRNIEIKKVVEVKFKEIADGLNITKENIQAILWEISKKSDKDSNRVNASLGLAKLMGYIKDTTIQNTIYNLQTSEEKKTLNDVLGRVRPQHIVSKDQNKDG